MLYCAVHTVAHWQAAVNDVLYCTCCIVQCTQWHTDRLLWMMYCTVHAVLCSAHSGTLTRSCEWCTVLYCTVHAVLCCAHSGTLTGSCEWCTVLYMLYCAVHTVAHWQAVVNVLTHRQTFRICERWEAVCTLLKTPCAAAWVWWHTVS